MFRITDKASAAAIVIVFATTSVWALTAEQEAKLLPGDGQPGDAFGLDVAVDGDTAVIGAHLDDDNASQSGSAYVFIRAGETWTEQAKLLPVDGADSDHFGASVAVDGDTAIIGSNRADDNGAQSGSAHVFTRTGSVWTQLTKLLPSDGVADARFGFSIALDGDTALIGAEGDDDNGLQSGSVYVFTRAANVWTETAKLLAADGASGEGFGASVALDGDTAVVGAAADDDNGAASGSAYVFTRTAGVWAEQAKLLAADGMADDQFGASVALSGETVLVGAYTDDDNNTTGGSAYVFTGTGGVWTEQAKLLPSDGSAIDNFGISVAVVGDTAVIGTRLDDDNGLNSGSAYIFTRAAGVWTEQTKLLPEDGAAGDEFGIRVAVDGDTVLGGAFFDDDNGPASGSAYVFRLIPGDDNVPAVSGIGIVCLLLTMLGGGIYFMRRERLGR